MRTYVVTDTHVTIAAGAGNRASAKAFEHAVREVSALREPKTAGAVDTSPERVARQFRDAVRKVVKGAELSGILTPEQADHARSILRLTTQRAVANIVQASGAFTFPIPGVGAVVMEGVPNGVGKITTASDRVQTRLNAAVRTMRRNAIEKAREDVKLIEAA